MRLLKRSPDDKRQDEIGVLSRGEIVTPGWNLVTSQVTWRKNRHFEVFPVLSC